MAKKNSKALMSVIKEDLKALGGMAVYNAVKDAIIKVIPSSVQLSGAKLEGVVAGVIYYYFTKNKRFGDNVSLAIRLEAMGDFIQVFGENIPFVGATIKQSVSPLIEGTEGADDNMIFINSLRDDDDFYGLEGYNPETDTFDIQGTNTNDKYVESI